MKKLILLIFVSFIVISCNMNPNKEARIQHLESKIEQHTKIIDSLNKRVQTLESINKQPINK